MQRAYLSAEDVSQAIIDAGMNLSPKDCSTIKFNAIAKILSDKMRQQVRAELADFVEKVLR